MFVESAVSNHPVSSLATGELAGMLLDKLGGQEPELLLVAITRSHSGALEDISTSLGSLIPAKNVLVMETDAVIAENFASQGRSSMAGWTLWGDPLSIVNGFFTAEGFPPDMPRSELQWIFRDESDTSATYLRWMMRQTKPIVGAVMRRHTFSLNGAIQRGGAVIISFEKAAGTGSAIPFGPLGPVFTVTQANERWVNQIAGMPAISFIRDRLDQQFSDQATVLIDQCLWGQVVDQNKSEFSQEDFRFLDILGIDEHSGSIILSDEVEIGAMAQLHWRDPEALLTRFELDALGASSGFFISDPQLLGDLELLSTKSDRWDQFNLLGLAANKQIWSDRRNLPNESTNRVVASFF